MTALDQLRAEYDWTVICIMNGSPDESTQCEFIHRQRELRAEIRHLRLRQANED